MKSSEFYKTKAWRIFTKYQLLKWSNNGTVFCTTCGKPMFVNDKQSCTGHLIKVFDGNSTNFSVAFDEFNSAPQCSHCNRYLSGRPDVMLRKLTEKYGSQEIEKLYIKKNNSLKLDKWILDLLYIEYKKKFDELVKIKGNPWK
jgi:hypothetical protein